MIGSAVPRKEDAALLTGRGTFVDDIQRPGLLHMVYVQSTEAHALITGIDTSAATTLPGVVGVWTAEDFAELPARPSVPGLERHYLAGDKVHYVGEPVAVVVAADRYAAADAARAVEVTYEPLPVMATLEAALAPDAVPIFAPLPGNVALEQPVTPDGVAAELDAAPRRLRARLVNQRVAGAPLEPYGVLADWVGNGVTVWATVQAPHRVRAEIAQVFGLARHLVRVVAPDVGGAFGVKSSFMPELFLAPELSRRLGRPVKFVEARREHMTHTYHGRDQVQEVEVGFDENGVILALDVTITVNIGGVPDPVGIGLPTLTSYMLGGCYRIPKIAARYRSVLTNTTPTASYRGAGRPEASFLIERVVDLVALELGKDPAEVRKVNLIGPEQMPYQTPFEGIVYDEADYPAALELLLGELDYDALRAEQERRRADPGARLLGVGLSTFVEMAGFGPTPLFEQFGYLGGWESANLRLQPDGSVIVLVGTAPHGQGHQTAMAQIVADELGVPFEAVSVLYGDTAVVQEGIGTMGSRGMPVAGNAVRQAAVEVADQARRIAAHLLEADPDDLVRVGDGFQVKGVPDAAVPLAAVVERSFKPHLLPEGTRLGLESTAYYEPKNLSYPSGAHGCVVEVERDTGRVHVVRYVCVDDCGTVINPMTARGQVHGGVAQGIAQALYEKVSFDAEGRPLAASLEEYMLPGMLDLPRYETHHIETRSSFNPLGVKGIGEAGATAAPQAVVNAVVDALAHLGVRDVEMPCTPERVWKAMHHAS
ncbi:xanthine dehydrogenase family protein molybdopterin-binding subunit [Nonomuraea wenchangensis]|uniref:Carbon-monoxide dehydrogenase large subunit n=1 Tax=Nonomuraea wenchangensis TaxID=568860 RepID=A0A1I0LQE8_9ACTN|nr:xanthine dehydrogenase family protein molybdopterin-binding subunit [Nonomuraea wenchangensis]SEU43167.1 carbon-monoxide dehydrogenase large subunit [Nonomuraea wenchangensis]